MSRAARSRSIALAVAWRNLHNFFTNPALIVPALLFPLFFFTAFAGGLSRVANVPGFDFPSGYTAFQFVFVLLQSAAFGGAYGFAMAMDYPKAGSRRAQDQRSGPRFAGGSFARCARARP